ncbi:hypothetical protein OAQ76_00260 [bacterium]|nr:hypothetical protein [bacterium]
MKIHHLGIVTTNVDDTLIALGLAKKSITEVVEDTNQMNRLHFVFIEENNLWLELVEPMNEKSSTYKFAKKNVVGLHHIAFANLNLEGLKVEIYERPQTYFLGSYEIEVGSFGGKIKTLFAAFNGLLIEFVEKVKKDHC